LGFIVAASHSSSSSRLVVSCGSTLAIINKRSAVATFATAPDTCAVQGVYAACVQGAYAAMHASCAVLMWHVLMCVLQDLMMPEVDGLDILRYVRSNTQLEGLPVISKS
jgi:CheY-like chemotaxis protein